MSAKDFLEKYGINNNTMANNIDSIQDLTNLMEEYAKQEITKFKNLGIADVSGSLLSDTEYWKQRCQLAEKYIEESPCDPDITSSQIEAHYKYNYFLTVNGNDR